MAKGRGRGLEAELNRKITALAEQLAEEIMDVAAAAIERTLCAPPEAAPRSPPPIRPAATNGANGAHHAAPSAPARRDIFFG